MTKRNIPNNEAAEIKYILTGQDQEEDVEIDLKVIINRVLKNWCFFLLTTVFALGIAYLANKYLQPEYKVGTSLVIKEENSMADPSALLSEIGIITGGDKNFINEVYLLKTSPLIQSAIDKLDLRVSYYKKETLGYKELYKSSPFLVLLNKEHPQPVGCRFSIKIISKKTIRLTLKQKRCDFIVLFLTKLPK